MSPVIGLILVLLTPRQNSQQIKMISLFSAGLSLLLSIGLYFQFNSGSTEFQFQERVPWVHSFGINYWIGVDGFSLGLILLTGIVIFSGVICSWSLEYRVKEFFSLLLFLVAGVFGVFMSLNLFFFFLFYEVAVLPMYLLILIWGSTNKEYAAMKLTIYLLLGSALMLTAFLAIYALPEVHTFDLITIKETAKFSFSLSKILYITIFFGCGVLAGCWPFHVWSPDGHVAAPTSVSMLHAGVLMKLGAFGIVRIGIYLFPEAALFWAPLTALLAAFNILYGAMVATQQNDLKYIIGFSSVSHMGFVLLGISTLSVTGLNGAFFQMFSHGIMTALLFACVGHVYDQCHTRYMNELGGLAKKIPVLTSFFVIAGLCGMGLPGMSGFPAELLVILAAFQKFPVIGVCAVIGLVVTAYYVLSAIQRSFYGPLNSRFSDIRDIGPWQYFGRAFLVFFLVLLGLFPNLFIKIVDPLSQLMLKGISS